MSLDIWLEAEDFTPADNGPCIFVRRDGRTVEISRAEWDSQHPGQEPVTFTGAVREVYSANITHNLGKMADAAGIYKVLWRPEENGIDTAAQLIEPLTRGLVALRADPVYFERFNAPNGWGLYKHFVPFVEEVLAACKEHPTARVRASI